MAFRVRLMSLKFLDNFGSGTLDGALEATAYAIDNGANVMNNSWGGGGYSGILEDLILESMNRGAVYVAAAGNSGTNNDGRPFYPAAYSVASIISVAAVDRKQRLAEFSNYGETSVHIGAPGVDILSTLPRNRNSYGELSGTSMAAPHVAGVAALVLAELGPLSPLEVKERLLRTVDPAPSLEGKTSSGGRLNARNALTGQTGEPLPGPEPGPGCGSVVGAPGGTIGLLAPLALVLAFHAVRGRSFRYLLEKIYSTGADHSAPCRPT